MSQVPVVSSEQGGGFQREPPVTSSSLSHLSLLATSHTGAAPKFLVRGRAGCRVHGGEQTPRQVAQNPNSGVGTRQTIASTRRLFQSDLSTQKGEDGVLGRLCKRGITVKGCWSQSARGQTPALLCVLHLGQIVWSLCASSVKQGD